MYVLRQCFQRRYVKGMQAVKSALFFLARTSVVASLFFRLLTNFSRFGKLSVSECLGKLSVSKVLGKLPVSKCLGKLD